MDIRLVATSIPDLFVVANEPHCDERGYFHRLFDTAAFERFGISFAPRQSGLSHNLRSGTLRGLHYQTGESAQAKLVRCLCGSAFDVAIDLRPTSPTFCEWFGIEINDVNHQALFVPAGFAHGFLTLQDNTDILYELSVPENSAAAAGVRWNDPRFSIKWPASPAILNERDASYPDFPLV